MQASKRLRLLTLFLLLLGGSGPAAALHILLTNDDGFEAANIQALYRALVAAEHDVILTAPYGGQSGTGGQLEILRPLTPTTEPSEGGLLPAGSPPLGPTTIAPQQFYVDSTPAVAVAYGIDVLAGRIWGQPPDLVISGPNEGNNLGVITPHSGTVGAAVFALNKQLPAIAVSAAGSDSNAAAVVAQLVVELVDALASEPGDLFPAGTGLNVNFPEIDPAQSTASDYRFVYTRLGTSADFGLRFYEDLGDSPVARSFGIPADIGLPGLSVDTSPAAAGYPTDDATASETNRLEVGVVTVSPIQGTYAASKRQEKQLGRRLRRLFARNR